MLVFAMTGCSDSNEPNDNTFKPPQTIGELKSMLGGEWEAVYYNTYHNPDAGYANDTCIIKLSFFSTDSIRLMSQIAENNNHGKFTSCDTISGTYQIISKDSIITPLGWCDINAQQEPKNERKHKIVFNSKDTIKITQLVSRYIDCQYEDVKLYRKEK